MEVPCPTCKKTVVWSKESPFRPFCSKRCQLIDLGEWSEEQKAIPGKPADSALPGQLPDIEEIEAMLAQQNQDFFKD